MLTTPWQGELRLSFSEQKGKTWLDRAFASAPLKVQKSFYPEGESWCHVATLHTAGGIAGGDRLAIECGLGRGAKVLITSATASKVYRSVADFSSQEIKLQLAEGSILEWLPQETILFANAKYTQKLKIQLAESALCCGWEINRFGRTAREEKFTGGIWKNHIEVWQEDHPLWIDRQYFIDQEDLEKSYNGLWQKSAIGTFWSVGREYSQATIDHLRSLVQNCPEEIGITRLEKGLVCRYRGNSTLICRQQFILIWQHLRSFYTQNPPTIPRIWQM